MGAREAVKPRAGPTRSAGPSSDPPAAIDLALYGVSALAIAIFLYYIPDYYFLEELTAKASAWAMGLIGMPSEFKVVGRGAFVNEVQIVRDCTGVQVIATFSGILIPIPKVAWWKKAVSIASVSLAVFVANVFRVVLELWLLYNGILPWELAHGPLGLLLGIVSVAFLVLLAHRLMPEFGEFLDLLIERVEGILIKGRTQRPG
ncbi:MAG: exosortase/archaeosortase family protein [Candidatus Bathyarchaeia archaeon]